MASDTVQSALLAQSINEYYLSAFDHALVVVGLVFGVVGVVVPAGVAFFQARQARQELEQIKRQISSEISSKVDEERKNLLESQAAALVAFGERSDKLIADLKNETKLQLGLAKAGTLHVQAVMFRRERKYIDAFRSATQAGFGYVAGEDFKHLRRVVEVIAIKCLEQLDGDVLSTRAKDVAQFEKLLSRMSSCDGKGAFSDLIAKARDELEKAQARNRGDAGN